MKEIFVNLGSDSYKICIGNKILDKIGNRLKSLNIGKKCIIITNPIVNKLYGSTVLDSLKKSGFDTIVVEVTDGEESKSFETANTLYNKLLTNGTDRKSCIIALGGGVIGDLAGFIAATYARGISFVQVPTTLLSQVDSSVGGKVAINHQKAKNLMGAFYQPKLVWIDVETLKTLPERELRSGLAEVIKYGMIFDKNLFFYLKNNISAIKNLETKTITNIIAKSCKIKAEIVEKDEKERNIRTILNYGHTFGHAIENLSNYKIRHGEAVAIGMICAAKMSKKIGKIDKTIVTEQEKLIKSFGLPTEIPQKISNSSIIKSMKLDKKILDDKIRLVLPRAIGEVFIEDTFSLKNLSEVIDSCAGNLNVNFCVCIAENSLDENIIAIKKAVENGANLIELRLDKMKSVDNLQKIIKSSKVPVIVTDRCNKNNLNLGIESGCNYVDIELETNSNLKKAIIKKAKAKKCKVILSTHDFEKTPSNKRLLDILNQQIAEGADIGKIVTKANSLNDCNNLLRLISKAKKKNFPLIAFALGDLGRFTRIIAPLIGSPFTYTTLEGQIEPGQLKINSLREIYKELVI